LKIKKIFGFNDQDNIKFFEKVKIYDIRHYFFSFLFLAIVF